MTAGFDDGAHLWLFETPVNRKGEKLEGSAYFDKIPKEWVAKYKGVEITRDMWRPLDPCDMDERFRAFISSHIPQFDQLIPYEEFYLYCEQSRRWEEDPSDYSDYTGQEQWDWVQRELGRIADNKLYGLNKYITIKEDGKAGGRRKYKASTPQAFLAFIVDRGNSFDLVKGRQAAITSTMLAIAALEAVVRQSYKGVFVTHDKGGTGKTLFEDKFKNTWQHLPNWITKEADKSGNWSREQVVIDFDPGEGKMDRKKDASYFDLKGSEDTQAINGLTPSQIYFDETQQIWTYQTIKAEADPTMYQFDEVEGTFRMVRQIFAWGTGSSNTSGKGAFEADFRGILDAWNSGADTYGWIPLFFNWTCRPGINRAFYEMQKQKYLRGQTEETKGLSMTERLSLFKAHYPSTPDDAFLTSHRTMVPPEVIVKQMERIAKECHMKGMAPETGRFVPVFDTNVTIPPGGWFEHPVKDVIWEPMPDDPDAPIRMMFPPERGWTGRYYQGTDPIENDGGLSRFASAIWDCAGRWEDTPDGRILIETLACTLNARTPYPEELFVQCILMGMYYRNHGQRACHELVEINAGKKYVDFKKGPCFNLGQSLVIRGVLPLNYKGGTHTYGIDLKGGKNGRKSQLYHDTIAMIREHGHNIWHYDFWVQVKNISVEEKEDSSYEWSCKIKGANDDLVFAVSYSNLCAKTMGHGHPPLRVDIDKPRMKKVTKRVRVPGTVKFKYVETMVPAKF